MARKKTKTAFEMFGPPIDRAVAVHLEGQPQGGALKRLKKVKPDALLRAMVHQSPKEMDDNNDRAPNGDFIAGNRYQWKPGQSGNPAGRPKSTTEMKQNFMAHTDLAQQVIFAAAEITLIRLNKALEVMRNPDATMEDIELAAGVLEKAGLDAAQGILDRGHGKPQQPIAINERDVFDEMDDAELDDYLVKTGIKVTAMMAARRKAKTDGS